MALSRRRFLHLGLAGGAGLAGLSRWTMAQETPPAPAPSAGRWLDAAVRAGRWIRTARVATPQGLLWLEGPERPDGLLSIPNLYSGSAGVVLFLTELARAIGDASWLEDASAGADALIAGLPAAIDPEKAEDGLYTGVPGIGFTLYRIAQATGKEAHRNGALRCLDLVQA